MVKISSIIVGLILLFTVFAVPLVFAGTSAFEASYVDPSNATEYTFAGADLGTPASDRQIVVMFSGRAGASNTLSSATINGVAATIFHQREGGGSVSGIIIADVPDDATGDIVLTFTGGMIRMGIGVVSANDLVGYITSSCDDYDSDPLTCTLSPITSDFIIVATSFAFDVTQSIWSNTTEVYDEAVEGAGLHAGSLDSFTSASSSVFISADWDTPTAQTHTLASVAIPFSTSTPPSSDPIVSSLTGVQAESQFRQTFYVSILLWITFLTAWFIIKIIIK